MLYEAKDLCDLNRWWKRWSIISDTLLIWFRVVINSDEFSGVFLFSFS